MQINLYKNIIYICIILFFLPFFVLYIISNTNANISFCNIFLAFLYITFIIHQKEKFKLLISRILHLPITKYYLYFIIYGIIAACIHALLGHYTATLYYYFIRFVRYYFSCVLLYLLPITALFCGISLKRFLKLFYFMIWVMFVFCIIQSICFAFEITPFYYINDILTNARHALYEYELSGMSYRSRVYGFMSEPSGLGQSIFIIMPFVLSLQKNCYRIYKNTILNIVIKKTTIPLMLITIVLNQSPIYLIFNMTEFFVILFVNNISIIKKYMFKIFTICLSVILALLMVIMINLSNIKQYIDSSYLNRISSVLEVCKSIEKIIYVEPSLGTRIVSYSTQLEVFKRNKLFGTGIINVEPYLANRFIKMAKLPLTQEIYTAYHNRSYMMPVNKSVCYTYLAELGLVGFLFYCIFAFKNIQFIAKLRKYYKNSRYETFITAILQSLVSIQIISFYNLHPQHTDTWFVYGLVLAILYNFQYKKELRGCNEEKNYITWS